MPDASVSFSATYDHPLGPVWARPGGPWDVPPLDLALTDATPADDPEHRVGHVAAGLRAAGVRAGDVVAWQRPNGPDVTALYRACWRLGAVAAPIHHRSGPADVDRLLCELAPRLSLGPDDPLPRARRAGAVRRGAVDVPPASVAVALATSGSTGAPKHVLHTHRGLVYKARLMADVHGLGASDHVLMPAPLAHVSGLLNGVLVPGVSGMRVTLMDRWDPHAALDLVERGRVTFMVGPPAFFVSLVEAPGFAPVRARSLRLLSCGGAGVTPELVDHASAMLGCRVKRTYGSTEAPSVTSWTDGDPAERARDRDGRPLGSAEVRVVAQVGDAGEVQVRGPELFVGYRDPAATRAAFTADGWFRTGDRGRLDADGWLTVVGRSDDMIIRGGENVAATEVAKVLAAHPAVRQAVVLGVPDHRLGERVGAVVVRAGAASLTVEDCRGWFAAHGVTRFAWPEVLVAVDRVPLHPNGKPDRAALLRLLDQESTVS